MNAHSATYLTPKLQDSGNTAAPQTAGIRRTLLPLLLQQQKGLISQKSHVVSIWRAAAIRRKLSEVFVIDDPGPGPASESDSGTLQCTHGLMEGSGPGTHMHSHALTCTAEGKHTHLSAYMHTGRTRSNTDSNAGKHALSSLSSHSLLSTLMQAKECSWPRSDLTSSISIVSISK